MRAVLAMLAAALVIAPEARAGAWVPVADAKLDAYPVLTAADGTAVTVYSGATDRPVLEIRRPGHEPRRLYPSPEWAQDIDVAVAPGGWVAAIWAEELGGKLEAAVIRPDGRVRRRALPGWYVQAPKAAIDGKGRATFAWVSPGGLRTAGSSLRASRVRRGVTAVDVAASPGGRRLLAWTTARGVFARLDGGRERRLATARKARYPAVEIGDREAAVVAYRHGGGVGVVDRGASGGWHRPRAVYDEFAGLPLTVVLSPRGRAAVAWDGDDAVHAVAGRAGGRWGTTTRLSSAVSGVSELTTRGAIDAAGNPSFVWGETFLGARGATFVPAAQPDATPLDVEVGFPPTAPSTTDGALTMPVSVRCSKPCDVDLRHGQNVANWLDRSLRAGEPTTIDLPINDLSLLFPRIDGRITLIVTAGDRLTGKVIKRTQPYTVDVVRPPLSSFKVPADHDFAMGTPDGNRAVAAFVNGLLDAFERGEATSTEALGSRYYPWVKSMEREGFQAVTNTGVVQRMNAALKIPAALAGCTVSAVIT